MSDSPVTWQDKGLYWLVTIHNPPVNATSTAVRRGLQQAITACVGDDKKAVLLHCSGATFVAGGDITEFDAPPQEPHLPDICLAIEQSPLPWVAVLHGHVIGGGLELAMSADFRIAHPKTKFGMAEVNVGLVPGAGGSQRLPRLVGMALAIKMLTAGRPVSCDAFAQAGGLSLVAEDAKQADDILAAAERFIAGLPARPQPVSQRQIAPFDHALIETTRAELMKKPSGQDAVLANLEMLELATKLPFDKAQPKERARHLAMRDTALSRALRYAFIAERKVAKPASIGDAKPLPIRQVGIVGGGLMGTGIAFACLLAGYDICVIERDDASIAGAKSKIDDMIKGALARGKIADSDPALLTQKLRFATDYAAISDASLVIEAVFEDMVVKQDVFRALAKTVSPDTILATNTSYLDPEQIMAGITNPERFVGLHFFSPAHIMKLLEIIKLPQTSPEVMATAFAFAKSLRKIGVQSGICDGFIGNRILAAYRRQADYMLMDGASPRQIDKAMRDFGLPMGPYQQQDLSGLQIAWANRQRQAPNRPKEERYVDIADRLCAMARFGQRSGAGWYDYQDGSKLPQQADKVTNVIAQARQEVGIIPQAFDDETIAGRLLAVMANEGALLVEEGIAERFVDVDMVKICGYGFPRWRGGPLHYAGEIGWHKIAQIMAEVAAQSPNSWRLAQQLKQ